MIHNFLGLAVILALWPALSLPQIARAANPRPQAVPSPKTQATQRPGIVAQRADGAKSLTLNPATPPTVDAVHSDGPTYFTLDRRGAQTVLAFHSSNPHLKLGTHAGFLIQLIAPAGVQVSPNLISSGEWPAGKTEIPIQVSGQAEAHSVWIQGAAAYLTCDDRVKDTPQRCQRTRASFALKTTPLKP